MKLSNWELTISAEGEFHAIHPTGTQLKWRGPAILTDSGITDLKFQEHVDGKAIWKSPDGLLVELSATSGPGGSLKLSTRVQNEGNSPIPLNEVRVLSACGINSPHRLDRFQKNGIDMIDSPAMEAAPIEGTSQSVAGFTDADGTGALVVGFLDLRDAFYQILARSSAGSVRQIEAKCNREGIPLQPGEELTISPLVIFCGESLSELMCQYGAVSGKAMNARHVPIKTGWCSWYHYYGSELIDDVRANMEAIRRSSIGDHVHVIQIDDGWNYPSVHSPRNWGDWEASGAKFPGGMKGIADEIKAMGFEPGLWLAPFSVDPASTFFKEHPDLLIQDESGPKCFWGVYGLDLTNPGALDFVRETFDRVFNIWGFTYIKIDFLLHAIMEGRRHNPSVTTAQALRRGLEVIREVAGDRFILTCGCPMGPAVGIADAMRIGMDISHRWHLPLNPGTWPYGNCSILPGSVYTLGRHWMHRNWWQNDPDCLLVDDKGSPAEVDMFQREFNREFADDPPFGLSDEEAGLWSRLVWTTGGLVLLGENLAAISPGRLPLLESCFPVNERLARRVDYYEDPFLIVMRLEGEPHTISIFNLSDKTQSVALPRTKLEMPSSWSMRERLLGTTFEGSGDLVTFPPIPPRAGRIWVAREP